MRPAERTARRSRCAAGRRPDRRVPARGPRERWLLAGLGLLFGLLALAWFEVGSGPSMAPPSLRAAR